MDHNELPTNSSTISNLNKSNVGDITSIIDSFENGKFYNTCETNLGCVLGVDIKHELDSLLTELNSKLIPCVLNDAKYFDKKELQDSCEKIRLIKQKFSKLYKFLKAAKRCDHKKNYDFVCNTCQQIISPKTTALSNIWNNLQQHDHCEEEFVHLLISREEDMEQCNEILNNNYNCNDDALTNSVSSIVAEVPREMPKLYEQPILENGSTSTVVSDNSLNKNESVTEPPLQVDMIFKKKLNCENCGMLANQFSDFKFNFEIMYNPTIENIIYWPKVIFSYKKELLDEIGQPFLQFKSKQLFTCLICNCDIPSYPDYYTIQEHIRGNRHLRKVSSTAIVESLFMYHENWKQQEPNYQAHQTYFLPLDISTTLCVSCGRNGTIVPYHFLKDHINSEKHKDNFFSKSNSKSKIKKMFESILCLQGEVYNNKTETCHVILNDCNENGYDKQPREKVKKPAKLIETNEASNENLAVATISKEFSNPTIAKKYNLEEKQKNNLMTELANAEISQTKQNKRTGTLIKSKPEDDVSALESAIIDARLNLRRSEAMLDNSNSKLNDLNSKSQDSSTKGKQLKHIIIKSAVNPSGTKLNEILDHRFLQHLPCFKINSTDTVTCEKCTITIPMLYKVIRQHICTKDHQVKANITNTAHQFYCEICNVLVRQDRRWEDHLKQQKHTERCERLGASRKNNITEYECETCKLVIFGDDLSIKRHSSSASRSGRFSKVKEIVLSSEVKNLFKSEQHIQNQHLLLISEANKVLANQDPVQECCRALETALADVYPNCKAYPFGSRVSGLGSEKSDLDVFVDMGDMYMGDKKQDPRSQEKFVNNACRIFRKKKDEFSHVNPIPTARTPIVQVYHKSSKLDCDLSFRHGLSVENTKYLRLCIELQPITQSLILLLKQWVVHCKLQEHMTTYALCMMVIFHMQVGGYLTPVHELRQLNPENVFVIDGWGVVDFSKSIPNLRERIVPYLGSVAGMLKEFFYYYSKFNYATDVICPLLGRPIKKVLFVDKPNGEDLPLEMLAYVRKVSSTDAEYFRARSPFCIQDPFDLSHNLVKACSPVIVDKLKIFCDLTLKHFNSICQ